MKKQGMIVHQIKMRLQSIKPSMAIIRMANLFALLAAFAFLTGCATSKIVAKSEGKGMRRTFNVSYDTAWMASRGAMAANDLRVLELNREGGSIVAKRDVNMTSFGMDVGVWVRPMGPQLTSVEVYTRRIWGPLLPLNLEKPILDDISTMLDQ